MPRSRVAAASSSGRRERPRTCVPRRRVDVGVAHLAAGVHPGIRAAGDDEAHRGRAAQDGGERVAEGALDGAASRLGGPPGERGPVVGQVDPDPQRHRASVVPLPGSPVLRWLPRRPPGTRLRHGIRRVPDAAPATTDPSGPDPDAERPPPGWEGGRSRSDGRTGLRPRRRPAASTAPPAGSNPAASAASASLNQNSAIVWSYHCEPSTWYFPESALPLTV